MLLKKVLRRKRTWVILIPALLVYLASPYVHFYRANEAWLADLGWSERSEASAGYVQGPVAKVRYVRLGQDPTKPLLVFVHGAPGSGIFWNPLLTDPQLQEAANLLVYDRPGYGGSAYGKAMTSVEEQARHLLALLENQLAPGQKLDIIGSSYGGTVAARLAMDQPQLVDGLMLQSASLKPGRERTFGITYPTSHWSLRWLVPGAWDVANQEKLTHESELLAMVPGWTHIEAETIIIQGSADWLIYPDNAYFACTQIDDCTDVIHHMIEDGAHDLIWAMPEVLRDYLLSLLKAT